MCTPPDTLEGVCGWDSTLRVHTMHPGGGGVPPNDAHKLDAQCVSLGMVYGGRLHEVPRVCVYIFGVSRVGFVGLGRGYGGNMVVVCVCVSVCV